MCVLFERYNEMWRRVLKGIYIYTDISYRMLLYNITTLRVGQIDTRRFIDDVDSFARTQSADGHTYNQHDDDSRKQWTMHPDERWDEKPVGVNNWPITPWLLYNVYIYIIYILVCCCRSHHQPPPLDDYTGLCVYNLRYDGPRRGNEKMKIIKHLVDCLKEFSISFIVESPSSGKLSGRGERRRKNMLLKQIHTGS